MRLLPAVAFTAVLAACRTGAGAQSPDMVGPPPPSPEGDDNGPKAMGYEFPLRVSFGELQGKYSDTEQNGLYRTGGLGNVAVKGQRLILESYSHAAGQFPNDQYGYALLEYRAETTNKDFWSKRQTAIALAGFVLPWWRLIAPVVGVQWEFNTVSVTVPDSPDAATADVRALVVGADVRQNIWGTGSWYSAYYQLKAHALNPGTANTGYELEGGLGSAFQRGFFRTDVTLGYLFQKYAATEPAPLGGGDLKVDSTYRALTAMLTLWL